MTLNAFVYFGLGFFLGSFTVVGLLMCLGLRGKRKRGRRSSHRRAAPHTA
jgi:hypothetical protein